MKALVTGMNGTVAPALASALIKQGHTVSRWNRDMIPPDNGAMMQDFIRYEKPDVLFHFASGSPQWAETMAKICARLEIKFVFAGTVSVFGHSQKGPFTTDILPAPQDDYGHYKLECETRIRRANPDAYLVRFGWQIGDGIGGNQMMDYLERTYNTMGRLSASTKWLQSCSFLSDTADAFIYITEKLPGGLYHLNSNQGFNFFEIVSGLKNYFNKPWHIEASEFPDLNNLLVDDRVLVRKLSDIFRP